MRQETSGLIASVAQPCAGAAEIGTPSTRRRTRDVSTPAPRARNNFDALRLIAALLVVYGHQTIDQTGTDHLRLVMFFSISGFLVAGSWNSDPQVWRFLARRLLRVWPAYAVMIVICAALSWLFPIGDMPGLSRLGSAYYLSNLWFMGFDWSYFPGQRAIMNLSLWMLPFEIDIYLAFAVVAMLGRRARIVGAIAILLLGARAEQTLATDRGLLECWSLYFSAFFAFGVLLREVPRLRDGAIVAASVAVGVALLAVGARSAGLLLIIPPAAVWVGSRSWPVFRAASRFGDLSYGIFLWSFPIQQVTRLWLAPHTPIAVQMVVVLAQVIPVAWLSCRFVETPALRRKPKRASGTSARTIGFEMPVSLGAKLMRLLPFRGAL